MADKIQGKIIDVDPQGDLITNIGHDQWDRISRTSDTKVIVDEEHETFGLFGLDHQQPAMTLIAIAEPQKPLRLHLVSDSASMMLGVRAGAPVEVIW